MKFRKLIEESINVANVDKYIHDMGITNLDVILDNKIIKIYGFMNRSTLDEFDDAMKEKYGRKYSFINFHPTHIAHFEIKIK